MTHSFTVTETELVGRLPMIASWSPELRANFVVGMNKLPQLIVDTPNTKRLAAVVIVHETQGAEAFILPRELAAERGRELGVHPYTIAALLDVTGPGWLDVLVLVAGGVEEIVFACPVASIRLSPVGRSKH